MNITQIIYGLDSEKQLAGILNKIHIQGPINLQDFEYLAYMKKFKPDVFSKFEKSIISLLGLFYKTTAAMGLLDEVYSILADTIETETGRRFTPVQADAYRKINNNTYFSFSAPTSSGKSYLFRELLTKTLGDIIIVVPSRALIAEYLYLISEIVEKDVLVLQFIEIINIKNTKRRIYIITPERGVELFKNLAYLNIELVLFDEAQISEEEIRGMKFDSLVRRIDKLLPLTKKVFTHPFVLNPEAQLSKHNFELNSDSYCYKQNSVGKICLSVKDYKFYYFSPYEIAKSKEEVATEDDIVEQTLEKNGTVLIYTSKTKIYDGGFLLDFAKYIDLCPKLEDPKAIEYINELRTFIGASAQGAEKHSVMIDMMEKGIVIHHGSIPLKARLLIEGFVNDNYAKICFSTSTLIQGINMPFDVVWINNFKFSGEESQKILDLKNLIGRAGRSTQIKDSFDYGYIIIERKNVALFKRRILDPATLRPVSLIDGNLQSINEDMKDIVQAIKTDTFNDDMQLTESQVERIRESNIDEYIKYILDNFLINNKAIKGADYYNLSKSKRALIKQSFQKIYISHLRRQNLTMSEKSILSTSIPILLWQIQGKSFAEIVSLRYAYITKKDVQRSIIRRVRDKELTVREGEALRDSIVLNYSPMASPLPNRNASNQSLFKRDSKISELEYDILVYDTYDYLDKVIAFSLADPLAAAFQLYFEKTQDNRASTMRNYIKYGTDDPTEIWLLRYGFSFEDVDWIKDNVISVDENEILFQPTISELTPEQYQVISRFVYS